MRFSVVVFASLAASVSASALYGRQAAAPPNCAIPCYTDPTLPFDTCQPTDNACLCKNQPFVQAVTACILSKCTVPADLAAAEAFAQGQCASAGVTLTGVPSQTGSGSGSGTPTGSPSPTTGTPTPTPSKTGAAVANKVPALFGAAFVGAFFAL